MNGGNADDGDDDEENDDGDDVLGAICPKVSDVRDALQVLRDYMPFSLNGGEIQQKLNALTAVVDRDVTDTLTETLLRTFFQ